MTRGVDLPHPPVHTVLNRHVLGQLVVLLAGKRAPQSGSSEVVVATLKGNASRLSVADGTGPHGAVVLGPVHVRQAAGSQVDLVAKSPVRQALTGLSFMVGRMVGRTVGRVIAHDRCCVTDALVLVTRFLVVWCVVDKELEGRVGKCRVVVPRPKSFPQGLHSRAAASNKKLLLNLKLRTRAVESPSVSLH